MMLLGGRTRGGTMSDDQAPEDIGLDCEVGHRYSRSAARARFEWGQG